MEIAEVKRRLGVVLDTLQLYADEAFDPEDAEDSDGLDQATRAAYLDAREFVVSEFATLLESE